MVAVRFIAGDVEAVLTAATTTDSCVVDPREQPYAVASETIHTVQAPARLGIGDPPCERAR
jgi:hypothetical protein